MAFDDEEWIRVFDAGLATAAKQLVPAAIEGHVPGYRNPNAFDPAAANALLDRTGYRREGDGYRRNPDGSPLAVILLTGTSSNARAQAEFHKRMLDRIGIRVMFDALPAAERHKRAAQCQYGMTGSDWAFDVPDGANVMSVFSSKAIGSANFTCFADTTFDTAFEKARTEPPGPSRTELFRIMQARLDALAVVRTRPSSEMLLLKRSGILGPFGTVNDWLQVVTLSTETGAARPSRPWRIDPERRNK
jgi:ABC-type transport system substrate-binding protein